MKARSYHPSYPWFHHIFNKFQAKPKKDIILLTKIHNNNEELIKKRLQLEVFIVGANQAYAKKYLNFGFTSRKNKKKKQSDEILIYLD